MVKDFKALTCLFVCFSKAFLRGEYVNVAACSIILLCSVGNISSPVRYLYISILPDDNAYISTISTIL